MGRPITRKSAPASMAWRGRGHAVLVAGVGAGGPDARGDDQRVGPDGRAQTGQVGGRADQAVAAAVPGQPGQALDTVLQGVVRRGRPRPSVLLGQAGQDGHRQQGRAGGRSGVEPGLRPGPRRRRSWRPGRCRRGWCTGRRPGGRPPGRPRPRCWGCHGTSGPGRHPGPSSCRRCTTSGPGGGEQLQADLDEAAAGAEPVGQVQGLVRRSGTSRAVMIRRSAGKIAQLAMQFASVHGGFAPS